MELVGLIILGIAVYAVIKLSETFDGTKHTPAAPPRLRPKYRPNPNSLKQRQNAPPAFDDRTARPDVRHRTLKGRAYIIDGDSLVIQNTQVRLFGIDAPELDHPFGQKAKWTLHRLCKGQTVLAEVVEIDGHGRTVAKCAFEDGRDLSAEMVRCGMAIDWPKYSGGAYQELEVPNIRNKLWLADARQNGRMHLWEQFEYTKMRAKLDNDTAD